MLWPVTMDVTVTSIVEHVTMFRTLTLVPILSLIDIRVAGASHRTDFNFYSVLA